VTRKNSKEKKKKRKGMVLKNQIGRTGQSGTVVKKRKGSIAIWFKNTKKKIPRMAFSNGGIRPTLGTEGA